MTATAPHPDPRINRPIRWVLWVGAGVVVVLLVILSFIVFTENSASNGNVQGSQQLASIEQICRQWSGPRVGDLSARSACNDMVGWMNQQLASDGHYGSTMWGTPTALAATCRDWMMTTFAPSLSNGSAAWCDQMVGWISQHVGNWNSWMMNGDMMGQ